MSDRKLKIVIIILAIIALFNTGAIVYLNALENAPQTNVQTTVLGAVIKDELKPNTGDIDLVRPPRKAVNPGDKHDQGMKFTNTAEFPLYFRSSHLLRIDDADGNKIEGFDSNVTIHINENWEYRDGYWYYKTMVAPGETIVGPVDSIEYSEAFADHRDYKVYVPMVIESVEARDNAIEDVDYWPDEDVSKIDYKRLNESASWMVKSKFKLMG